MLEAIFPHTSGFLTLVHASPVNRIRVTGASVEKRKETEEEEERGGGEQSPMKLSHPIRRKMGKSQQRKSFFFFPSVEIFLDNRRSVMRVAMRV